MEADQITFTGDDNWLVVDLYRFLHTLNVFYNRLYVLKNYSKSIRKPLPIELKKSLDNSLYKLKSGDELKIESIKLQSPLEINLKGAGEIFKEIRMFYKDVKYRNEFEEHERTIDIEIKSAERDKKALELREKEYDAEMKRIKVIGEKIELLKNMGFSEKEIREIGKSLMLPAQKLINSGKKNNVRLVERKKETGRLPRKMDS